jgi:pyruvate kinase
MVSYRLLERTLTAVRALQERALRFEAEHAAEVEAVEPRSRNSARNLLHYLSVRQQDIRHLQQDLHTLGLSSFSGLESHVLASLNAVIVNLEQMAGEAPADPVSPPVDFRTGPLLLRDHARRLLGPTHRFRMGRIMVTAPSEAASDVELLVSLMRAGMDVLRINCAHDDAITWRRMAKNLRKAERTVGRRCLIQADLAGPKIRTGAIGPVGHFVRVKPARDLVGRLRAPAQVWLTASESPEPAPAGVPAIRLPKAFLEQLSARDELRIADMRDTERKLTVIRQFRSSWLAETRHSVYVAQGASCALRRGDSIVAESLVGDLPGVVSPIPLRIGDELELTREDAPGTPAVVDDSGIVLKRARIHCTLAAAFVRVKAGDQVWLDDGRIGGTVAANDGSRITISVTCAPPGGAKLRAEKGINFPDTDLALGALTEKDLDDLRAVGSFADIVALSFVRTPDHVESLHEHLQSLSGQQLGTVLKIENAEAFRNLPRLLLTSLRFPPVGVMVARGDLAVEIGFERLSEVQEEILWLCEAAHVPVIWATQVLDSLAKKGAPSRAEVSDAVMSSRAECVMLNKGRHIVSAVAFLSNVQGRMEEHYDKRMALLRRLSVSEL